MRKAVDALSCAVEDGIDPAVVKVVQTAVEKSFDRWQIGIPRPRVVTIVVEDKATLPMHGGPAGRIGCGLFDRRLPGRRGRVD